MTSSVEIAAALGPPLLRVVVAGENRPARDVFVAEPDDAAAGQPDDLVLGVGVSGAEEAVRLVERCVDAGASGVVLRSSSALLEPVTTSARRAGMTLVAAGDGIPWAHLVWLLRGVIDRSGVPGSGMPGSSDKGLPRGGHDDLFALADTVASIVGGPVTFEDSRSRVLAYSSGQGQTDTARVATIIGRRVPEEVAAHFRALGVFRRLARSSEPFLISEGPDGTLPRLVVPVRAGGEWLGSMWAVVSGPVDDATTGELRRAASVLALHLLRLRAQADLARRSATDLLRAALSQYSPERLIDQVLPGPGPWRVAALSAPESHDAGEQLQVWETVLRRHGWRGAALADVDGVVFAVVGERVPDGTKVGSWNWLQRLVAETENDDNRGWAAVAGSPVSASGLPHSRAEAAELLGLLRSGDVSGPALAVESAWDAVVVNRVVASVDLAVAGGPLPALLDHDVRHGTEYVPTLAAWLRHHGEPLRAARELQIHPNTLRYRMHRLQGVIDLDLNDPRRRLALQLQISSALRNQR
ncbi:PucR family transcriptional regulator [Actinopolymorpha alba]|uniref:PucR family transcriptional regulator n=1 Tax=Actinopolymorpha alba TaxID=533267 RepID=UPI0003A97DC3|nr:helix-turn-helix domain-containing protein [Actinopolymorpha alba]